MCYFKGLFRCHMLVLVEFSLSVSDFRTEKIFDLTKITCYTVLACVYAFYMYNLCVYVYMHQLMYFIMLR